MSRRALGLALALLGFATSATGAVGLLLDRAPRGEVQAIQAEATPSAPVVRTTGDPPGFYDGVHDDSAGDLVACADGKPLPGGPAHLDLLRISTRDGENPESKRASANLLLDVAAASTTPEEGFSARVLVEPPGGLPAGEVLEWRLVYAGGAFSRQASVLRDGGAHEAPDEDFRIRYQGFGDRVEIEFYGPPGTRYRAATLTDGTVCDHA